MQKWFNFAGKKIETPQTHKGRKQPKNSSSLERNTIKYSGKVLTRFASTSALRKVVLSPLATNVATNEKYLGFWSVRLSELADTFFEYRFTRLRLRFTGDVDSLYVSCIAVGFSNAVGTLADPGSQYQVMDCPWSKAVLDRLSRPPENFSVPKQYLLPPLTKWLKCTTAADDNMELQGVLYFYCDAPAVESYVSTCEIDYAIEFRNPIYVGATPATDQKYLRMTEDEKTDDSDKDSVVVPSVSSKNTQRKK